jgi:GNAT superfamily N-acetyltransferase
MNQIEVNLISNKDEKLIYLISRWYHQEWSIPPERTVQRIMSHPNDDVLFQYILTINSTPAATGGLYQNVGLHQVYPEYKKWGPWVALIYTDPKFRNLGLGSRLLHEIEEQAYERNFKDLYLFTFTAEDLYKRNGWSELDRVDYHYKDTVIMTKRLED